MSLVSFKKKSLIFYVLIFFFCFSLLNLMSVKAETSGEVPVTYVHDSADEYIIKVNSNGPGEVRYGTMVVRNEEKKFILIDDNSMQLAIKADNAAQIKSVYLNGENITSDIKDNLITIKGNYSDQTLNVEFMKINEIPQTGDNTNLGKYVGLILLTTGIIMFLISKKRKTESEVEEDEK